MAKASIMPHRVIFTHRVPGRLHVVIGGGSYAMIGGVFLLPGLALMLIGFHLIPIAGENFMINGIPVLGLFGLPFFLVGGSIICYRRWLTFDLSRSTLTIASGTLIPMLRRERSLREFTAVTILYQIDSSSGGDGTGGCAEYYPVILTAGAGGKDYSFNNNTTYGKAFAQAASLAEFLGLPVKDLSSDHPLEIAPADLASPLQARLRADAALIDHTPVPAMLRSQVAESATGVQISIPGQVTDRWVYWLTFLLFLPAVAVFFHFIWPDAPSARGPMGLLYPLIGFGLLMICWPLFSRLKAYMQAHRTWTMVSVDSQGMTIEERRGKKSHMKVCLSLIEILDVDYGIAGIRRFDSTGVCVKARNGRYTFGAGLPDDEVTYLATVLKKALRLSISG